MLMGCGPLRRCNWPTVLDDNCTLCLPNSERIKLDPARMRMLFEVADLAVASPATVSRCGMVYVSPEDSGWRPYVRYASHHTHRPCSTINALRADSPPARGVALAGVLSGAWCCRSWLSRIAHAVPSYLAR
jgi:hypothetical protein